jgi:hypothetical protein
VNVVMLMMSYYDSDAHCPGEDNILTWEHNSTVADDFMISCNS